MRKNLLLRSLALFILCIAGCMVSYAKVLVPFYKTSGQAWEGRYYSAPISETGAPEDWYATDFDDSLWGVLTGPLYLSSGSWQAN